MSQTQVACQACQTKFTVATPEAAATAILNDDEFSSFVAHHPRTPCPECGLLHTTLLTGVSAQWGVAVSRNQTPPQGKSRIEVVSGSGPIPIEWGKK
ncbi:MAG: hypothetical protein KGL39_15925 [Patescibacteria group bacterium]|nr:hypothetical protein [Patescibacteria group bacterium]